MGIGTRITMRVEIEPKEREVELETLLLCDKVARIELEAFLEEAIKTFLSFHFKKDIVADINITIE